MAVGFEPSRNKTVSRSDAKCLNSLGDFRLIVKYRVLKWEWPRT